MRSRYGCAFLPAAQLNRIFLCPLLNRSRTKLRNAEPLFAENHSRAKVGLQRGPDLLYFVIWLSKF